MFKVIKFIREKFFGAKADKSEGLLYPLQDSRSYGAAPVSVLKGAKIEKPLKYIQQSNADDGVKNRAKRLARQGKGAELQALAQSIANK